MYWRRSAVRLVSATRMVAPCDSSVFVAGTTGRTALRRRYSALTVASCMQTPAQLALCCNGRFERLASERQKSEPCATSELTSTWLKQIKNIVLRGIIWWEIGRNKIIPKTN